MADPNYHALYLNGLNKGTISRGEQRAINTANMNGFQIKHIPIHWLSGESFVDLLQRTAKITEDELKQHGKLLLIGASAGGSLAINVFGQLQGYDIRVVTLCSRLQEAKLPLWDPRSLDRMAHIGTDQESQSFFDSVHFCTEQTLPRLSPEAKKRIIMVRQWADEVVPRPTMNIASLATFTVPGFGHHYGIVLGIKHLGAIVRQLGQA